MTNTRRLFIGGTLAALASAIIGGEGSGKSRQTCNAPRGLTCKQDTRIRGVLKARMAGFDALADEHGICTKLIEWPDDFTAIASCETPSGEHAGVFTFDANTRDWTLWDGCMQYGMDFQRCYRHRSHAPLMTYADWRHWYLTN